MAATYWLRETPPVHKLNDKRNWVASDESSHDLRSWTVPRACVTGCTALRTDVSVTAAWRNLQRLKLDFHAFVDRTRPHMHREAVAVGGEGPSCDRLSGSHNEPALTQELPPVEVAKALDLGKADISSRRASSAAV